MAALAFAKQYELRYVITAVYSMSKYEIFAQHFYPYWLSQSFSTFSRARFIFDAILRDDRNIRETPNETKFLCDSQNPAMSSKIAQGRDNPTRKTQRNIGDARSEGDRKEERKRERWTRK